MQHPHLSSSFPKRRSPSSISMMGHHGEHGAYRRHAAGLNSKCSLVCRRETVILQRLVLLITSMTLTTQ